MAISPVGDIVLDVIRAADPMEAQAARQRLAAGQAAAPGSFSVNSDDTNTGSVSAVKTDRFAPRVEAKADGPYTRFEAMVLQNFVSTMLPNDKEAYGGGTGSDLWKGLMAEKIANAMAERGGIGIADRLLADHYKTADGKTASLGPARSAPTQGAAGDAMLSSALVSQMQRRAAGSLLGAAPAADD